MNPLDVDYNSLSPQEKRDFVKAEIQRQRTKRQRSPLSPELTEAFTSLACQLSPENISGDGEYSPAEVRRRKRQIQLEWAELEKQAGRRVDFSEFPF